MEKYTSKIIQDYIDGNEIRKYSLEELENDADFMKEVLKTTKDYKMYNLCSERLKQDYDFVKWVILKFKNNITFIDKVASEYLDTAYNPVLYNPYDTENTIDLYLLMIDLTKGQEELHQKYRLFLYSNDCALQSIIKETKDELSEEELNEIGMGFYFILDSYNSEEIRYHYAVAMMDEILQKHQFTLERILHQYYSDAKQLDTIPKSVLILRFVEYYDPALAAYAFNKPALLKDFKKKIQLFQKRWDIYIKKQEEQRYLELLEQVHDFLYTSNGKSDVNGNEILYYIGYKLGISEKLAEYEGLSAEHYASLLEGIKKGYLTGPHKDNLTERICHNRLKEMLLKTILNSQFKTTNKGKGRIININQSK